ncbi:type II toxin-antitoxin system RelE/ParE family toxin [Lacticaseibacillus zeae]|uniref:type II toxin-antitoxin system RelE/ParE family toxin n=1 Tax=Lacticaseibacillus zeae TaxID=57037 RepID=UPI000AB77825
MTRAFLIKKLDTSICELRLRLGKNQQRRLYFHVSGNDYVVTHDFSKKSLEPLQKESPHATGVHTELYRVYEEKDDR